MLGILCSCAMQHQEQAFILLSSFCIGLWSDVFNLKYLFVYFLSLSATTYNGEWKKHILFLYFGFTSCSSWFYEEKHIDILRYFRVAFVFVCLGQTPDHGWQHLWSKNFFPPQTVLSSAKNHSEWTLGSVRRTAFLLGYNHHHYLFSNVFVIYWGTFSQFNHLVCMRALIVSE